MSNKSKIEWTDITWNPVTGCDKISPGCKNCYAERMSKRLKGRFGYPEDNPFQVTIHNERLDEPFLWKKPRRVFVCSMGDLFHDDVSDDFIQDVFEIMINNSKHTYIVLTKRPQRMAEFLERKKIPLCPACRPHIWLGVTAENQKMADERIPILLDIPAAVRFVSIEPILDWVRIEKYLTIASEGEWMNMVECGITESKLDWVIVGEESGHNARKINPILIRDLRAQCAGAGVPFFLKQMWIDGKLVNMPKLDGRIHNNFPLPLGERARVRGTDGPMPCMEEVCDDKKENKIK